MVRLLVGVVGIVLLVAAVITSMSIRSFVATAAQADGVVVALVSGGSHPRLRFTAADGSAVTFSGNGLIFGYAVGQHAPVLYSADSPQTSATLQTPGSLWFAPILLLAVGLGCLFVPLGGWLF